MKLQSFNHTSIKKGKTIRPEQLFKIFINCDIQVIVNDFENNNIQQLILNNWDVVYYFYVFNSILTFSPNEYEIVHQSLKSFIRDHKIEYLFKNK